MSTFPESASFPVGPPSHSRPTTVSSAADDSNPWAKLLNQPSVHSSTIYDSQDMEAT